MYFSKLICHFLLICFHVNMCKISAKSDKFFLSFSNLFGSPFFIQAQCIFTNHFTVGFGRVIFRLVYCCDVTSLPCFFAVQCLLLNKETVHLYFTNIN